MDKNGIAAAKDMGIQILDSFVSLLGMLGAFLAVVLSWQENHSLLWVIAHGWLGWIYVFWSLNYLTWCAITTSSLLTGYYVRFTILKSRYDKSRNLFNVLSSIQERLRNERENDKEDQQR